MVTVKGFWRFGLVKHIEFSELNELLGKFEKSELVESSARDGGLAYKVSEGHKDSIRTFL